jgi:WD40 repeat protein
VGAISVLRTADGQEVDLLRHEQISLERVRSLRYSHDGAMLASVGDEGLLSIWSVDSGQMHTELRLGDPLTDLTWLDQNRLFSVGQGGRFALEIR